MWLWYLIRYCLVLDSVLRDFGGVTIPQEMLADGLAVDLSAVGAVEIFQNEVIADGGDYGMLRAYGGKSMTRSLQGARPIVVCLLARASSCNTLPPSNDRLIIAISPTALFNLRPLS